MTTPPPVTPQQLAAVDAAFAQYEALLERAVKEGTYKKSTVRHDYLHRARYFVEWLHDEWNPLIGRPRRKG